MKIYQEKWLKLGKIGRAKLRNLCSILREVIPSLVTLFHASAPATPYCEDFIVSVVLGKDAVPR